MATPGASLSYQRVSLQDEKLLVDAAKQDLAQFQTLYALYFSQIYHYCYFHTFDPIVAEDLCSDIFLKALEAFPKFTWKNVPFGAWLQRIASNRLKNHYRDHKALIDLEEVENFDFGEGDGMLDKLAAAERKLVVKEVLKTLGFSCQEVLIYRFFHDFSYDQIASQVEKSVAACKMQVKRCLAKMKVTIQARSPEIIAAHPAFTK